MVDHQFTATGTSLQHVYAPFYGGVTGLKLTENRPAVLFLGNPAVVLTKNVDFFAHSRLQT